MWIRALGLESETDLAGFTNWMSFLHIQLVMVLRQIQNANFTGCQKNSSNPTTGQVFWYFHFAMKKII